MLIIYLLSHLHVFPREILLICMSVHAIVIFTCLVICVLGSSQVQDKQIIRLIGKIPTLSALAYHKSTGRKAAPPNQRMSYSENFLYMLDGGASPDYRPNPRLARALVRPCQENGIDLLSYTYLYL